MKRYIPNKETIRVQGPYVNFADVELLIAEIERLRGEVEEFTNKLQMMKDESILFKVNVGLARDLKNAITERDAAVRLLSAIRQDDQCMHWHEDIDAARGEA